MCIRMCIYEIVYVCEYAYAYTCIYMCVYMCISAFVRVCSCIREYVCMYEYFMRMNIHVHTMNEWRFLDDACILYIRTYQVRQYRHACMHSYRLAYWHARIHIQIHTYTLQIPLPILFELS
jgi:hypothetical protein